MTLFKVKWYPKFEGVDPEIKPYVDEWFGLAFLYGLKFNNKVSIGFDNIKKTNVIAQCEYGFGFREITVDSTYWKNMNPIDRAVTVEHELSHCYCNEGHQYGKEHRKYNNDGINPPEAFFDDFCPKSLMYPYSIDQGCIYRHFSEYVDDMFKNCKPY